MSDGFSDLGAAIGLVFVIEGLMLALAPGMPKRLAAALATIAEPRLRVIGLIAAAIGVAVVWFVRG
jgi:uncharacterized protein YjeT (DUF2065 family)